MEAPNPSITSIEYRADPNSTSCCRLANFKSDNIAGIPTKLTFLGGINDYIKTESELFYTYTLPHADIQQDKREKEATWWTCKAIPGQTGYDVFQDGTSFVDMLWEKKMKPEKYAGGNCTIAPFAIPYKSNGSLVVKINTHGAKFAPGNYTLIGKCVGTEIFQFTSATFTADKIHEGSTMEIATALNWKNLPNECNMGAFRGDILWSFVSADNKATNLLAGEKDNNKTTPVEFYIIGSAVPAYYGDLDNTFGIPVYLLRLLLRSSPVECMALADYRQMVVSWAFSRSGKVYKRYTGGIKRGEDGPRYFHELQPPRSEGVSYDALLLQGHKPSDPEMKYASDRNSRFMIDRYILESLYAEKNNVTNVMELPRVQCSDQCYIVLNALNIGCMDKKEQAQVLKITVPGEAMKIRVDCQLVGYQDRCNNPLLKSDQHEAKGTNIGADLFLKDMTKEMGFRQHWCVVIGPMTLKSGTKEDPITDDDREKSIVFDSCVQCLEDGKFLSHCGVGLRKYLTLLKSYYPEGEREKLELVALPDMDMFFESPRYWHPYLSEWFDYIPKDKQ